MGEAERVTDFMSGKLTNARQRDLNWVIGGARAGFRSACKSFEDHPVLAHPLTAENDAGFQHFARTRIINPAAI